MPAGATGTRDAHEEVAETVVELLDVGSTRRRAERGQVRPTAVAPPAGTADSSQCDLVLMRNLVFISNVNVVFRMMKIVVDVDLICPPLIRVIQRHRSVGGNLLERVITVELVYRQQLSGKFADSPHMSPFDIIKIHIDAREKMSGVCIENRERGGCGRIKIKVMENTSDGGRLVFRDESLAGLLDGSEKQFCKS